MCAGHEAGRAKGKGHPVKFEQYDWSQNEGDLSKLGVWVKEKGHLNIHHEC